MSKQLVLADLLYKTRSTALGCGFPLILPVSTHAQAALDASLYDTNDLVVSARHTASMGSVSSPTRSSTVWSLERIVGQISQREKPQYYSIATDLVKL